jgi:two-component system sensor histidine kinase BarA
MTEDVLREVAETPSSIEVLVEPDAILSVCRSVHDLFGVGVRVYSAGGTQLAAVAPELELCRYANEFSESSKACAATVAAARGLVPEALVLHPCFTGLSYAVAPLVYEAQSIGRVVFGPFALLGEDDTPRRLALVEPRVNTMREGELFARAPRVRAEALRKIVAHIQETLELLAFSGHRVWLTSHVHLHTVRENFRELEEKNERLEQSLARLREADRLKSSFLATMSHELRTPLTSIIGYSEMLAEGIAGQLSEEQTQYVRTIHEKGEQLLRLIAGLLDLSKLESGTMRLRQSPTQLGPILEQVISTLKPVSLKKGVSLSLDLDLTPCELAADAERLRQVFVNLVDNAVKFTPAGGSVAVYARIAQLEVIETEIEDEDIVGAALCAPALHAVEVRIEDTGIGIAESEHERVFDAFYQVDSSSTREYGGTGLGLAIVKPIVEAHGGRVTIQGRKGGGSVFIVVLPSAQARRVGLPSRVPPVAS